VLERYKPGLANNAEKWHVFRRSRGRLDKPRAGISTRLRSNRSGGRRDGENIALGVKELCHRYSEMRIAARRNLIGGLSQSSSESGKWREMQ